MALVLSRNVGEAIIVRAPDGTEIRFEIAEFYRGRVRVGVIAPLDYQIRRGPNIKCVEKQDGDSRSGHLVRGPLGSHISRQSK